MNVTLNKRSTASTEKDYGKLCNDHALHPQLQLFKQDYRPHTKSMHSISLQAINRRRHCRLCQGNYPKGKSRNG